MFTARVFWRRLSVLKSGTAQSRADQNGRLSANPVVCRSAMAKRTLICQHRRGCPDLPFPQIQRFMGKGSKGRTDERRGNFGADTAASGVNLCFANPGTSEMHFVAALDRHPEMRCILCLFEGGVSGAADGYFRMTWRGRGHAAASCARVRQRLCQPAQRQEGAKRGPEHHGRPCRLSPALRGAAEGRHGRRRPGSFALDARDLGTADGWPRDAADAIQAARSRNGQIATLILPANMAWDPADGHAVAPAPPPLRRPSSDEIAAAARALRQPGAILLVDGPVLWSDLGLLAKRLTKAAGRAADAALLRQLASGAGLGR